MQRKWRQQQRQEKASYTHNQTDRQGWRSHLASVGSVVSVAHADAVRAAPVLTTLNSIARILAASACRVGNGRLGTGRALRASEAIERLVLVGATTLAADGFGAI